MHISNTGSSSDRALIDIVRKLVCNTKSCRSPETYSEKLRLQLASLAQRFAGFKSSIAEDTRRRRLLEEERYKQLHHALQAIEDGIAVEMRKRGEARKGALDHLITRCEELEQGVNCLKGEHASKLLRQSAELMARCRATRAAFEAEVLSRNEREDAAGNKLEELLKSLDSKVESEIAARHQQVAAVRRDVGLLLRGDQPREQFHTFVKEELGELREGLTAAMRAREEADDEILQAINEYTTALQRGLQNVSGLHTISSVL
ncbi:SF-assemblin [Cyclospora cayetanensis]|uniref:SF-assemblin n=1 Tax=Cyclospora cayetanensis TaxID=88456 RepID=A0A6P6RTK8_9EIME|nr:SF-assemblin [Cyclospora cayetanensis]